LWVGQRTTPNTTEQSSDAINREYGQVPRSSTVGGSGTPYQLTRMAIARSGPGTLPAPVSLFPITSPRAGVHILMGAMMVMCVRGSGSHSEHPTHMLAYLSK
jgi:hypothetical protein